MLTSKRSSSQLNAKDKENKERRRNTIVLVQRFLLDNGWIDSALKLEQESTIKAGDWIVGDNINLNVILHEFEEYYALKYGSAPVLVKKNPDGDLSGMIKGKRSSKLPPVDTNEKRKRPKTREKGSSGNGRKSAGKTTDQDSKNNNNGLEIAGEHIERKEKDDLIEQDDEYFKNRVLKGLPDAFMEDPQLRALAQGLQRDIIIASPNVKFSEIVGLEGAKKILREAVKLPLIYPELFTGLIEPWKGVLLFGPPGTGKTMLAKAVASECHTIFFNISASSIVSKWQGESEKLIRVLFDLARHHQPSTIFLDEIDSIMSKRSGGNQHEASRRLKTELLIQMDGLMKNDEQVFVLAASNLPWDLDEALLRRLEKRIYVPLPDVESRRDMVAKFIPDRDSKIDLNNLAGLTEGYSGSDIRSFSKEALMRPVRRFIDKMELPNGQYKKIKGNFKVDQVTEEDIMKALECSKPSPAPNHTSYIKWSDNYGST